ncbi:choice-of-anchor L domain-containing protein [Kordia algicida OT-1]|uniref:Secretion system C-terminal sorting domain-containing protein n=1 Tax=Kordia algicida OT-1 TaxID=391587 RepID=A9DQ60_9FLAO|nr:choice-of-anchor L domain-containing protein [Kordia algicida]EDP96581.1 hypothetical protein KAOT1_15498 [Kordia algicida OT-1]
MKKIYYFLAIITFLPLVALGQINVNTNLDNNALIQTLGGNGVDISNVNVTAANGSYGQFTNGGFGIAQGVLLTTGSIQDAVGPNDVRNAATDTNAGGSALLDALVNDGATQDATIITFDIVPEGTNISFNYVFASEEYHRFVNSQFNDVFGFFISGPGINGNQNIATIPGGNTPVAINTVNNGQSNDCNAPGGGTNSNFFIDNCNGNSIQYDGHTTVLQAVANNLQACQTYTITLAIADVSDGIFDSGVFIQQGTFSSNDSAVDFHFEHENGVEDTVFNLCEDVILDGTGTTATGSYFIDIWRVNGDGSVSWLSNQNDDGWAQGFPNPVNITQIFVDDEDNPVTFQAGVTYEVKLAIVDPNCGWISETRRFTYEEGQMSSAFDIINYDCYDGVFDVTVIAQDTAPNQWWRVYETSVPGSTTDADTIGPVSEIQGDITVTFTELDPTRFYYIKHGVWTNNCPWQETRIPLTPDCCDEFDSADFSVGVDFDYDFWVGSYEGYQDIGATHEWYILSSPNETGGPYTPVFSTTTTGGNDFELYTDGQFGVYYTIIHKVVSYCGEICYGQVQYQKEAETLRKENSAIAAEVDCCLVFDFWPNGPGAPEEFTAAFDIGIDPQSGTIQTFVPNTYPNNSSIEHEWTLFSSPNETGGPYILVDESTAVNYSYSSAQNGLYYFLFHKVKSDCGEVCFAQTICRNCGEATVAGNCELCGVIDCSLIDEIKESICDAPTSLVYSCKTSTLNWEDIPNADSYIVEIIWDDPECCKSTQSNAPQQWMVTESKFQLPYINVSGCFSWKIGVKCKEDIVWSNKKCSSCFTKPHDGPTKPQEPSASDVKTEAKISPNPNDGNMNIEISGKDKTNFTISVYRFDGTLIKTFDQNRIENNSINISWNGKSVLTQGMYFFVITTDTETITKKIMVE